MKKHRVIVLTLIIAILIGASGCGMSQERSENKQQQIIEDMKDHLKVKYGDIDYQVEGFIAAGWDHPYDVLNLSIELDGIEESFRVERHSKDKEYTFKDNYFGLLVRSEFEKKIAEYAARYFQEYKIYAAMKAANYSNELDKDANLEDLMDEKANIGDITFIVLVKEGFQSVDEFENAAKEFVKEWAELGVPSTPRVIYLTEDVFETTGRENYRNVLVNNRITEYSEVVN